MSVTLSDLHDEVDILVRDTSDEIANLIDIKINEAFAMVHDLVVIPDLKRIDIFTTVPDQAWTTMPTGFNGKLLFVGNDSTSLAIADAGVEQLMEVTPLLDESGPVHTVALEGNTLYYQGIPDSATTYPILYVVKPTPLVKDRDEVPSYIPEHLQRGLFVHLAASLLFNIIEDGIEGEKVNTSAQRYLHNGYMEQFNAHLASRRTASARSVWAY